ncbi:MAG: CoB--CoM heterodisulfide reductase iron-sulfur subunit A family protein [Deltaproteobacteria bacterium]|jgi:heterodisulfide reductase subunit A|nr:CoB--CoM heterodisulfide reductase iron-sulfur subunit A family protein [Deltaproteobacteria bacterium]
MAELNVMEFDAIVIGGGMAGLQTALDLADQNFKVAVVEKDATIGGKMIRLSKVFPTLDCASCITTPKMASAAHHDNISIFTYCDLNSIERDGDGIVASLTQRPRYVDADKCIGCRQCEYGCPVYVPDEEQGGFTLRKAIHIPFSNAIPQLAILDAENCSLCGKCDRVCPTQAVDYFQQPEDFIIQAKTAVLATGFKLTDSGQKKEYGQGRVENVITSMQMERLLAPHGPYQRVIRPSDGKEPESIAYVQCVGSRDKSLVISYCSRVCCMYAIKQAMLLSGALPLADITIYYMDIRAFGKGYEQFYQNAKAMGIEFVKAKVAKISRGDNQSVQLRYEDPEGQGGVLTRDHDLVVLSLGMLPEWNPAGICPVSTGADAFIKTIMPKAAPALTDVEGIFVAGVAAGPKDIVDTIAEAGAAGMEASNYLCQFKKTDGREQKMEERIQAVAGG